MATIKSFTDLSQSKVLAEILPLESADMCWQYQKDRWVGEPDYNEFPQFKHATDKRDVPCWSLTALLVVLPYGYSSVLTKSFNGKDYYCKIDGKPFESKADNPIDACYGVIIKLHELNLL